MMTFIYTILIGESYAKTHDNRELFIERLRSFISDDILYW
jgi:hypothetical protein